MGDDYKNKHCVTKSKLYNNCIKTLSKYEDSYRVAAKQTNKQTQRHSNWQTFRQNNILKEQKDKLTNRRTSRLIVDTRTEAGKKCGSRG